jgi:NAD(P)-dependent dehydrogenase (short-subunit alcohol dehydrogenase family)
MGDAWDVAKAVAFLASDDASYITATEIVVDGGLSASALGHPWDDQEKNL